MNTKLKTLLRFKHILENMDNEIEDLWEYVRIIDRNDLSNELNDLDNFNTILANKLDEVIWKILGESENNEQSN